jgi:hypothetical protein
MNTKLISLIPFMGALLMAPAQSTAPSHPNEISPAERAAGWTLLFDGKTTQGWRSFKKPGFPKKGWEVHDGWLTCVAGGRGGDIISADAFEDFELSWEWRLPPKANNGLKYFVTESRERPLGHEYQMIDEAIAPGPLHSTAAFYDVLPPATNKPVRLPGEINQSRVLVRGNHVEHWLNGTQVLEYELGSEVVKAGIARSKFKSVEGFGQKTKGHILLTEHHDEASFRNLKIRRL